MQLYKGEKNMKLKYLKKIAPIFLGIILGFVVHYFVISELIEDYFRMNENLYWIITFGVFIFEIVGSILFCWILINQNIDLLTYQILVVTYILFMCALLFARPSLERSYNFNLIQSIAEIQFEDIKMIVLNFAAFLPFGYIFKSISKKRIFPVILVLACCIEVLQFITKRGVLDILDLLIYVVSILLSYFIVNRFKINIVKEN